MPSAMEPSANPAPTFQSSQDAQTAALQQSALRTLLLSKSPCATGRVVGWLQYLQNCLSVHNVQELDALDLATLKLWADPGVDQAMRMDPHLFAVLNQRLPKIASTSAGSTGGAGGGASNAGNVTGAEGPSTGKALKVFRKQFPKDQCLAVAGPYDDFDAGRAAITTERERTRAEREREYERHVLDLMGEKRA